MRKNIDTIEDFESATECLNDSCPIYAEWIDEDGVTRRFRFVGSSLSQQIGLILELSEIDQ